MINQWKTEETQITNIRNERQCIIMDITDIERIIIGYHEQFHDNKFDNLIEEDKVWKKQIAKTDTRIN